MMVLCDTNVVIDLLDRLRPHNPRTLELVAKVGVDNLYISVVTEMEMVRGFRNREHGNSLLKKMGNLNIVPLSKGIGLRASSLIKAHHLSHDLDSPMPSSRPRHWKRDCPCPPTTKGISGSLQDWGFISPKRLQ